MAVTCQPGCSAWWLLPLFLVHCSCVRAGFGVSSVADRERTPSERAATTDASGPANGWSKRFGDSANQVGLSLAVDRATDVYLAGYFAGAVDFGGGPLISAGNVDACVASFSSAGVPRWSKRFGDALEQIAADLAVDGSGNLYVTGHFRGSADFGGGPLTSAGDRDVFLASFTSAGVHRWSKRFGDVATQQAIAVTVDGSGNLYLTGTLAGTVDFGGGPLTSAPNSTEAYVASFSSASGSHRWSKRFGGSTKQLGADLCVDHDGNLYLVGHFVGSSDFGGGALVSAGGSDVFVASFSSGGGHRWSKRFGDASEQYAENVGVDASGNLYLLASVIGTADFGGGPLTSAGGFDLFVASFNSSGTHRWSKRFGDAAVQAGDDLSVDSKGNIWLTGRFEGTVDFGGGALVSAGGSDVFVASFDSGGVHRASRRFGDVLDQRGLGIVFDGNLYLTGLFEGSLDFGQGPLVFAGGSDIFLAKLAF